MFTKTTIGLYLYKVWRNNCFLQILVDFFAHLWPKSLTVSVIAHYLYCACIEFEEFCLRVCGISNASLLSQILSADKRERLVQRFWQLHIIMSVSPVRIKFWINTRKGWYWFVLCRSRDNFILQVHEAHDLTALFCEGLFLITVYVCF